MWPWGHLAVGYLLYTGLVRARDGERPADMATVILVFGTQFPDLVDKPLSWTFGVLPTGRTLAHSLLIAIPLTILVYWYLREHDRAEWGVAFGVGYLSHVIVDALPAILRGEFAEATFLVWPLLPVPPYEESRSIIGHFLAMEPTLSLAFEAILFLVCVFVWDQDGRPGITPLQRFLKRIRATIRS